MHGIRQIHRHPGLRRIVLGLLRRFNPGDIRIRHHYTGRRLILHSYRHKGYWYHGRRREQATMQFFAAAIQPGDAVIEVGGHIGYISMYLASLVGEAGKVYVFEPGSNNLPYIRGNVGSLGNIELLEQAVSNSIGVASFFEEELTGQNNSLLNDYPVFASNREKSYSQEDYRVREVPTVTLDSFTSERGITPSLIKIDVEGAEWMALQGARVLLAEKKPVLMVEVTHEKTAVVNFLHGLDYVLFDEDGRRLQCADDIKCNVCALHRNQHHGLADKLGWRIEE